MRYVSLPPGDGYGAAAQGYLGLLERLGVPVRWEPISPGTRQRVCVSDRHSRFTGWIDRPVAYDTVIVHLPPDWVPEHLSGDGDRHRLAFTTGEIDVIPETWVRALDSVDRVVVPSTFNQRVFAASGVTTPISVVGHVGDLDLDVAPFHHESLGDRFVFYTIGPWTTRKGLPETVLAFADAFAGSDEVALVIKTGLVDHQAKARQALAARATVREAGDQDPPVGELRMETWWSLAQLLATRPEAPPVLLAPDDWDDAAMAGLHRGGDCLVSLNRGEGFGLTVLDAARAGNPPVITGWGGALDITGDDWPLLVGYELVTTADDRLDDWMRPSHAQRWARADHDDAVDRLRWVFDHRAEAQELGRSLATRAEARFGVEPVTAALAAVLDPRPEPS